MKEERIVKIRTITLSLWLCFPVFVLATPIIEAVFGLKDWRGVFILIYMSLCGGFAYALQKAKCPNCKNYMFREGKRKHALQKFLFRQCGQCGYKLGSHNK